MKRRNTFLTLGFLLAATASAEEYKFFSGANYGHTEYSESYSLQAQYFFEAKESLGPLNEFKYINTNSYVSGLLSHFSPIDSQSAAIGGEWIGHSIGIGGSATYQNDENESGYEASQAFAKYFFSDLLYAGISYSDFESGDSAVGVSAAYELPLNNSDYLGFSGGYTKTDESKRSSWNIRSKYYNDLNNGKYWVLTGGYSTTHYDEPSYESNSWGLDTTFYFSKFTSIGLTYSQRSSDVGTDSNSTSGRVTHYFTPNLYLSGSYSLTKYNSSSVDDNERYRLTVGLQY